MNDRIKSLLAVVCGNVLEYFNMILYVHLLFILTPLFLPESDSRVADFIALSSVAISYFIRPLGGIAFGYIGDRWGRKKALTFSLTLMFIPTFMMGILPTYAQVGIIAPILLFFCRILQNFCVSGEVTGAALTLIENAPSGYEGRFSSLLMFSEAIGGILAICVGSLSIYLFPVSGWRIPFLIGSGIGLFSIYLRRILRETPPFQELIKKKYLHKNPLWSTVKQYKNFLCGIGIGAGVKVSFFITFIHLASVLKHQLHLDGHRIMLHNLLLLFISMIAMPIMRACADRFGITLVMKVAAALLFFCSYPLFVIITKMQHQHTFFLAQIPLVLAHAGLSAPTAALAISLFPVGCRYSGMSFTWALSGMLFIGILPAVKLLLGHWLADPAALGYYLAFCGMLCWLAVHYRKPVS